MTAATRSTDLATDLIDALSEYWAVDVRASTLVNGEHDQTYRVATDRGDLAVKVRSADTDHNVLDFELAVLRQLAANDVPAPHVLTTIAGEAYVEVDGRLLWALEWIPGRPWAAIAHPSPQLHADLGRVAHGTVTALSELVDSAAARTHHWDVRTADASLSLHADEAAGDQQRRVVEAALAMFAERVAPRLPTLPTGVVHQDLNDHNLLISGAGRDQRVAGVLDSGDALHSVLVAELAVAVAYAMLRSSHPLDVACRVVRGWCELGDLTDDEIECILPMAIARLCVNATTWAHRSSRGKAEYAHERSAFTWEALERLESIHLDVAAAALREAAGHDLDPHLDSARRAACSAGECRAVDVGGPLNVAGMDPHLEIFDRVDPTDLDAVAAAGRGSTPDYLPHLGIRLDRGGRADGNGGPATMQLGGVVRVPGGAIVRLPVAGDVVAVDDHVLTIRHGDGDARFWSLWSGLALDAGVTPGAALDACAHLGTGTEVHVRLSLVDPWSAVHTVGIPPFIRPGDRAVFAALSPDPASFLGIDAEPEPTDWLSGDDVIRLREERLATSQRSYYERPMNLVSARGTWFVDDRAHHYLDAINNVTHVGHGHPHVVDAAERQMRRLNTNSRFVYEGMARYADRLAAALPDPLEVVFLVCSGSEANDLALRISRQVTGRDDIMVIDGAYHGNTTAVTGISPNRYRGSGGSGPPPTTHEVLQPNMYRGPHAAAPDAGLRYAADVADVAARLASEQRPPAAFIAESLMGTAGQIVHPDGYLAASFEHARAAGALCISDEVQVGFGRLGHHFWGFELGGVVPDIVTMGKPMGNGHPIAALVTTREIADAFDTGMKYFNTFGGNPVSCAVAGAVLDVIHDEGLQGRALEVGGRFRQRLDALAERHEIIGDIRGEGLYLGVEFVESRVTRAPAAAFTSAVCERMRERGVIVYPNGDLGNVLKIKPPMVITDDEVAIFVDELDAVVTELT